MNRLLCWQLASAYCKWKIYFAVLLTRQLSEQNAVELVTPNHRTKPRTIDLLIFLLQVISRKWNRHVHKLIILINSPSYLSSALMTSQKYFHDVIGTNGRRRTLATGEWACRQRPKSIIWPSHTFNSIPKPEKSQLLGKYKFLADLLFDWLGCSAFVYI